MTTDNPLSAEQLDALAERVLGKPKIPGEHEYKCWWEGCNVTLRTQDSCTDHGWGHGVLWISPDEVPEDDGWEVELCMEHNRELCRLLGIVSDQQQDDPKDPAAERGMEYLRKIPKVVPPGKILVHNHIVPITRRLGLRGFRAWLAEPGPKYVRCQCPWAPELPEHYKVQDRILALRDLRFLLDRATNAVGTAAGVADVAYEGDGDDVMDEIISEINRAEEALNEAYNMVEQAQGQQPTD